MIVIPKEKPVHEKLSTYYLDYDKFLEYSKRELGSGCVFLKTPSSRGVVFFDTDEILNSVYHNSDGKVTTGDAAQRKLSDAIKKQSFQVALYKIDFNHIYSWINLHEKPELENDVDAKNLSLEELIKKMSSQKLTGFIDAQIDDDAGLLIFQDGQIVGGSYSWGDGKLESDEKNMALLIDRSKKSGGVFQVKGAFASPEKIFDMSSNKHIHIDKAASSTIATLEELLDIFERVVRQESDIDTDFNILLKNKFVEKVGIYPFLDPFANEFSYVDQKITFKGKATDEELTEGVSECVRELADELRVLHILKKEIANWSTYLGEDIALICKRFL